MPYGIGELRTDIDSLRTYADDGHGINTGNVYKLSNLDGDPVLLAFLRRGSSVSYEWLSSIIRLNDPGFKIYLVACRHNGTSFSAGTSNDVLGLIGGAGLSDSDFYSIPFVYDDLGTVSQAFWLGLANDAAGYHDPGTIPDVWTYLIDPARYNTDKWHPGSVVGGANDDPSWFCNIHVVHLELTGGFSAGSSATVDIGSDGWMDGTNQVAVDFDGASYDCTVNTDDPRILSVHLIVTSDATPRVILEIQLPAVTPGADLPTHYAVTPATQFGLTITSGLFNSADDGTDHFANTERYARARLRYLGEDPRLLYPIPEAGALLTAYPGAPDYVSLVFSKLLEDSAAVNAVNYLAGNTGSNGLTFAPQHHRHSSRIILQKSGGALNNPVGPPSPLDIDLVSANPANDLRDTEDNLLVGDLSVGYLVDLRPPSVTKVYAVTDDGTYGKDSVIEIAVEFSEEVIVSLAGGTPYLELATVVSPTPYPQAEYHDGSPGRTLYFRYTVGADESSSDLDYAETSSLKLGGGEIKDAAGYDAVLTLPAPGTAGSLGEQSDIVIDTSPCRDIVFVLDYSGSMDTEIEFGVPPVSKPKVEWVKEAATDFVTHLLPEATFSAYRIGIVLYSTDGIAPLQLTTKTELQADPTLLTIALEQLPRRDLTAMGKGLSWALQMLHYEQTASAYGQPRTVLLFADGQQNVAPYVDTLETNTSHDGKDELSIDLTPGCAGCPPGMGPVHITGGEIPIHTFGIGGNPTWFVRLADIKDVTDANGYVNEEVWPNVYENFVNLLPDLFPDSSPQIVQNSLETYQPGATNRFVLELDASIRKLTVSLSWPGSRSLQCVLRKGKTIIFFSALVQKDGLFIGSVTFPHYQAIMGHLQPVGYQIDRRLSVGEGRSIIERRKPLFEHDGEPVVAKKLPAHLFGTFEALGTWQLEVIGAKETTIPAEGFPYHLAVIVDEKELKCTVSRFRSVYWAGEAIPLGMGVLKNGRPLSVSPRIDVGISYPATSLNALLGKDPSLPSKILGGQVPTDPDKVSAALEKIAASPIVRTTLSKRIRKIVHIGSGFPLLRRFRGQQEKAMLSTFSKTRSVGAYHVDYRVSVDQGKAGGMYRRSVSRSVLVLPKPELAYSLLEGKLAGKTLMVSFTPKDRYGNYLGPGMGDDFSVHIGKLRVAGVKDELNGTYTLTVPIPDGGIPDFTKLKEPAFEALMSSYFARVGRR